MKLTHWKRGCQALIVSVMVSLFVIAGICHAQITNATVTGEIKDSQGAVVPGASVTLTNTSTNVDSTTVTNEQGTYRTPGLIPGVYKATVSKPGFKSLVKNAIELHAEDEIGLSFTLEVGAITETVTVTAGEPLIETQSTSLGETIEGREVDDAPLNGRNPMNLVALVPGVVPQGNSQGSASSNQGVNSANPAGFGNYQIGGGIAGWNATFVDGANVNASGQNWQALVPTQDSVAEFRVDTNAVTPEYGRFAGGIINFSTKSGGNKFHGTAYEYVRNTIFDANTFFNDRNGAPVPELHQNQFGATLGGPIVRDKAFFFFSWESVRLAESFSQLYRVPTPAEMSGDFTADYGTATDGILDWYQAGLGGNPAPPEFCPGGGINKICPQHLDPTAQKMYQLNFFLPMETNAAKLATLEQNGYNSDTVGKQENLAPQYVARIDDQLSLKQHLFGRYTYWHDYIDVPTNSPSPAVPVGPNTFTTQQIVLGDNYTLSSTLNANFMIAYYRFIFDVGTAGNGNYNMAQLGTNWATIGSQLSFKAPPTLFPGISWPNEATFLNLDQHNHNDNYSVSANLVKVKGHHSIQFGGEGRRVEYYSVTNIYPGGNFLFPAGGIAEFVGGASLYIPGLTQLEVAQAPSAYHYYQGYYVTDAWQITPKLTANLGVRWELPGTWYEKHDHNSVLLPNKANPLGSFANPVPGGPTQLMGELVAVNSPDYRSRGQTEQHLHLFDPRIGLNYAANPNTVIRLGFGITNPCLDCGSVASEVANSPFSSAVTPNQPGFSSLSNPYPNGILQPLGRSLDAMEPYSVFPQTLIGADIDNQEPYQRYPYIAQWNLNVEQAFGSSTSIMLAYVGARGVHLGGQDINLDQLPDQYDSLGATLLTQVANPLHGIATPSGNVGGVTANYGQFLEPYPEFSTFESGDKFYGETSYHALSASLKKRFRAGSTVNAAYTWAHNIGNIDSANGYLEPGAPQNGFGPQDHTNPRGDRSNSAGDIRQRMTIEYILDLPLGKGKRFLGGATGFLDEVVSGWSLNGITTFQSGLPLGLSTPGDELSSTFGAGTIRPILVPGVSKTLPGSAYERTLPGHTWFNTAAFVAPATTDFVFGNESRIDSTLRMEGTDNWDMNLSKSFPVKDRFSIQFRAEYFNVFNRPQFGLPSQSSNVEAGSGSFGVFNAIINQPRIGQFSIRLNY